MSFSLKKIALISSALLLLAMAYFGINGFRYNTTLRVNNDKLLWIKNDLNRLDGILVSTSKLESDIFMVLYEGQSINNKKDLIHSHLDSMSLDMNKISQVNLDAVIKSHKKMAEVVPSFIQMSSTSDEPVPVVVQEQVVEAFKSLDLDAKKMVVVLNEDFRRIVDENRKFSVVMSRVLSIGVLVVLFLMVLTILLIYHLVSSINKLNHQIKAISRGEFEFQGKKVTSQDELGELQTGLDRARESLLENQRIIKKKTDDLTKAYEEADEASQAKSKFMGMMSHEIRTPLNGILPNNEMLLDDVLAIKHILNTIAKDPGNAHLNVSVRKILYLLGNQEELLVIQQESGVLLSSIVDDILDSMKIQNSDLEIVPHEEDLIKLCKNTVSFQRNTALKKHLELNLDVDNAILPNCKFDGTFLKRVLNNLINNAIKFTKEGHVDLKLALVNRSGTHQAVKFSVIDTGVGVEKDKLSLIFEPFKQEDSSVRRHAGGTGLGLFICKNIIEAMGSQITISSEKGKGTEFSFVLELELSTNLEFGKPTEVPLRLDDLKVLVVDDNKLNCSVLGKMLQGYGAKVMVATSGEEAVKQYLEQSPRVVFMDYHMPGMDGYEASMNIRKLEKAHSKAPCIVIACTADAQEGQDLRLREAGMDGMVTKPLSKKSVERVLSQLPLRQGG